MTMLVLVCNIENNMFMPRLCYIKICLKELVVCVQNGNNFINSLYTRSLPFLNYHVQTLWKFIWIRNMYLLSYKQTMTSMYMFK